MFDYPYSNLSTKRDLRKVKGVMIHRVGWIDSEWPDEYRKNARGLYEFFTKHPEARAASGGQIPYDYLVWPNSDVNEIRPIDQWSPHALGQSKYYFAIGMVGDFRKELPTLRQLLAASTLYRRLHDLVGGSLVGHDEVAGASRDPNKECPGKFLNFNSLLVEGWINK